MAVNLVAPEPASLLAIDGIELGFAEAGIRKTGRRDLMVMRFAAGTRIAGVFTPCSHSGCSRPSVSRRRSDPSLSPLASVPPSGLNVRAYTTALWSWCNSMEHYHRSGRSGLSARPRVR